MKMWFLAVGSHFIGIHAFIGILLKVYSELHVELHFHFITSRWSYESLEIQRFLYFYLLSAFSTESWVEPV